MSILVVSPSCTCQADRIRNGLPVKKEITAIVTERAGELPELHLFSDWSEKKRDWRTRDVYQVEEISTPMEGRAFLLHRSPEAIARDGIRDLTEEPTNRYGTFLAQNGQDHICECKGFASRGYCKHVSGLIAVITAGQLEHPMAGAPVQQFPSSEQVASDALIEAPF
jgi:hypothetical protein